MTHKIPIHASIVSARNAEPVTFYPEAKGKRAKMINVELRAPNGSNLRDQTWRHQIVEKYLARWGLIKKAMAAVA